MLQQHSSSSSDPACVPVNEESRRTLRPSFYKAISNSLQCLLDNPDTVHLLQQQGALSFISIFSFFFFLLLRAGHSAGLSGRESHRSGIQADEKKGCACGAGQKTFGIDVTRPSLNTQFSDLAGSTVNGQLSRLIQQSERWLACKHRNASSIQSGALLSSRWMNTFSGDETGETMLLSASKLFILMVQDSAANKSSLFSCCSTVITLSGLYLVNTNAKGVLI